ncbi:MAG: 2Fe-2S iron-sulfur cluster binding domain-containing protein [Deltaproteobacteria bacterium]|nr:2Fe-2S iron-sulfur cluster binding domain-containing protein [Deltaproteobacteria bacterium]
MPSFTLDGQQVPYEPGDTILRAAWRAGIEIPHYCWHPGLSVAANCRMCLVHIESGRQMAMPILRFDQAKQTYVPDTKPKLMPACQFPAGDDLVVSSTSEVVKTAQQHVQEWLLLNHPVDCPICDQAGECKLQDYWATHDQQMKRKRTEIVHKPKAVRFGPTIVYDAERCISCTRCVRVCDELVGDHVLDSRERGNRSEIFVAPGRELDHRYTLMTEHVCPVGALTSRDFRFKARVWFLKSANGICSGCAKGCNMHVDYDPRSREVERLRPRDNMDVNQFWMCDDGMMSYKAVREDRVLTGLVGRGEARERVAASAALAFAVERLSAVPADKVAFVLSATASTEENAALARLAEAMGSVHLYLAARPDWEGDDILRSADHNPNRAGANLAAGHALEESVEDLVSDLLAGAVGAVVAVGADSAEALEALAPMAALDASVVFASNHGVLSDAASVVVPIASWAESVGTYVNEQGRAQAYRRAVTPPGGVQEGWRAIADLAEALGHGLGVERTEELMPMPAANEAAAAAEVTA